MLVPTASVETAERELSSTNRRAADVQRRTFQLGVPAAMRAIAEVSALLAEADRALQAARAGDLDAGQKLRRLLMDVNTALDDAEALLEWPDLDARRAAQARPTRRWSRSGERPPNSSLRTGAGGGRPGAPAQRRRRAGAAPGRDARAGSGRVLPRPALDDRRNRVGRRARDRGDGRRGGARLLDRARALQAHGSPAEPAGGGLRRCADRRRNLGSVSELARAAGEELRFGDPMIAMRPTATRSRTCSGRGWESVPRARGRAGGQRRRDRAPGTAPARGARGGTGRRRRSRRRSAPRADTELVRAAMADCGIRPGGWLTNGGRAAWSRRRDHRRRGDSARVARAADPRRGRSPGARDGRRAPAAGLDAGVGDGAAQPRRVGRRVGRGSLGG